MIDKEIKIVMIWTKIPSCGLLTLDSLRAYPKFRLISTYDTPLSKEEISLFEGRLELIKTINDINIHDLTNESDVFILPGWNDPIILSIAKLAKRNNKKVVLASDNNKKNNLRQFLGGYYFRIIFKKYYDLAFVPGISGKSLMREFGFKSDEIITGLYGASEIIFSNNRPYIGRDKEFLFVGQLIKRKSFPLLIESYIEYLSDGGTWNLKIVGSGEFENLIPKNDKIKHYGQIDSFNVSNLMNNSRALILISTEEHWGTVVCEAAACGLPLILGSKVGSLRDMLLDNGLIISSMRKNKIISALKRLESLSDQKLLVMSNNSEKIASKFTSKHFLISINQIISKISKD